MAVPRPGVVIWGASGHALVVADIVRLAGQFEVIGFLDDLSPERRGHRFCGATVLGGSEELQGLYGRGVHHVLIAVGDCKARIRLAASAREHGFDLALAIHPCATIASDVQIGAGSVIAAGAVINPGSVIGENVIINTSASVDHECIVEDGAHICPGARLAGRVTVGRGSWVGIGASVVDHVRIGAGAIIGAGAVVTLDIPDGVVAFGLPAKVRREVRPT
jgi:acetyltransferase EpsM